MGQTSNSSESGIFDNIDIHVKKILLATDGSAPALQATEYAIALARVMGASIKAVFVEDSRPGSAGLEVAQLYAEKNNIAYEASIIKGSVAKAITEAAEAYGADVIIVGNTGRTGLRRIALGSVAEDVVKSSRIPVLVLKAN